MDDVLGFAFPFRIDPATGGVAQTRGRDKVRQNLRVILGTRRGERPMLRDFGTRIYSLVHEPNDSVLADLIRKEAQEALLAWEPRVIVTAARVEQQEGEATLRVSYTHTTEPVADALLVPLG